MASNKLTKNFEDAVNYVNNNKDLNISSDEKLTLYKYFKQATIGNINISKPSMLSFNQEPLLKYNAWLSVKNCSKENAMTQYINITNKYKSQNNNTNIDLLNQLANINDNLQKR